MTPIERLKRARERYGSLLSVDRGSVEMAAIYLESQFGFPVDGKSMMEEMKVSALAELIAAVDEVVKGERE